MKELEAHEIANIWPMMFDHELAEMAKNIKENGLLDPITLYEGKILDGRNRYAACGIAGVEPTTVEYTGDTPVSYAVGKNMERRQLSSAQKAALAVRALPHIEAEAKKRQQAAGRANTNPEGKNQHAENDSRKLEEKVPQATTQAAKPQEAKPKVQKDKPKAAPAKKRNDQARTVAAKEFKTNDNYISKVKKIEQEAPELVEQMATGTLSMKDAIKEVSRIPKSDWSESELERQAKVLQGTSVLANANKDKNLLRWAEAKALTVNIGRGSDFGNPFVMDQGNRKKDGSRDMVCDHYEKDYLPYKPLIRSQLHKLRGKVLVCYCYPERCHGDSLLDALDKLIEEEEAAIEAAEV